ncbi:ATP-binding protein [Methanococcoides methylutens]|uniref:ATP-binding protein n=1 Tax=Methanococcoides methylutens TaxID=2226 RepID=UPI00404415A1
MISKGEFERSACVMVNSNDQMDVEGINTVNGDDWGIYRQLFNEMPCAYALHEIIMGENNVPCDYRFLDVNPAFENIVGLSRDEVVGKSALEIFPHIGSCWVERFGKIALTGQSAQFDNYSLKDGVAHKVKAFCPVPGNFAVTFSDLAESKCMTGIMQKQYQYPFSNMTGAQFLHYVFKVINNVPSLESGFLQVVKMVSSGMQYPSIACSRIIFDDLVFLSDNFEISQCKYVADILVDGVVHGRIEVYYTEELPDVVNGPFLKEEVDLVDCISDYLGRFVERMLVAKDLSIFKTISDKANYGIAVLDMKGTLLYLNEAFATMHGYSLEDVLGGHFLMFYNEEQVPRLKYLRDKVLDEGHFKQECVWHMRKNGSIFPAMLDSHVIFEGDNMPSHLSVMLHDISESKKAEDTLKRAKALEDAANCSKSEFLANVSHELRTPLNSIIGFSEILLDGRCGTLNDVQQKYLQNVFQNGNNLSEIINDILEVSMIEAGKVEASFEKFSIIPVIVEIKDSIMHSLLKKGVSFSYDVDPELPLINADKAKFKHIIYNLLSNAIKFSSEGGSVDIEAKILGWMVHIIIRDDGIGIPKEQLPHLYDTFYQGDGSTKRLYSGTGLGLGLTKKLVSLHEGQMWVESEQGKGTTVHVMLPI